VQAGEVEIILTGDGSRGGKRDAAQGAESDEESDGCDVAQDCNPTY